MAADCRGPRPRDDRPIEVVVTSYRAEAIPPYFSTGACPTIQPSAVTPTSQTVGKRFRLKDDANVTKATQKLRLLKKLKCTLKYEKLAWAEGARLVAGVDEVGRGSLFGAVVAAAVILDPNYRIRGLRDSKLLPRKRREVLAERIRQHCLGYAIRAVDAARIDQINIYHASRLAMREAVLALEPAPDHLLIDALRIEC